MKNFTHLLLASSALLACVPGFAQGKPTATVSNPDIQSPLYHLSAHNKYAAGEMNGRVSLLDMETGEVQEYYDEMIAGAAGKAVSDEGIIGGQYGMDMMAPAALWYGGEAWETLPEPDGCLEGMNSAVQGMTGDGKYVVGYASLLSGGYCPVLWTLQDDGSYKAEILPSPEKDLWGMAPQMTLAQGVSEDGKVIYGRFVDYTGFVYLAIVWKQNAEGGYDYELLGKDYVIIGTENPGPQPQMEDYITAEDGSDEYWEQIEAFDKIAAEWNEKAGKYAILAMDAKDRISTASGMISGNGRYLCVAIPNHPRVYDLETGKFTEWEMEDCLVNSVSDKGTAVFAAPGNEATRTAYIAQAGETELVALHSWLTENYNVKYEEGSDSQDTMIGTCKIAFDESVIIAWNADDMNYFNTKVIKLSGSAGVEDAVAADVNIRVNGGVIAVSEVAESIEVYNVAGQKVAEVENAAELAAPASGAYIVKAVVDGTPVVKKVVL